MRLVYAVVCGLLMTCPLRAFAGAPGGAPAAPAGSISPSPLPRFTPSIVHSHFGGQIFGFDIDQNGNEGVLTEALEMTNGSILTAIETFDQRTGEIIRIVSQTLSDADDFLTLGVVGSHIGLVEFEHELSFLHLQRTYLTMNPLATNTLTGHWEPPIDAHHIIEAVSRNQGPTLNAVYAFDNGTTFQPQVFVTNVATNTFGPLIVMTNGSFQTGLIPKIAYNPNTDLAFLGVQTIGNAFIAPTFAQVDMQSGQTIIFSGAGTGDVNGLALDPVTNRACATTEIDFSVEFYDLATRSGFAEPLPGANNQFNSGADVAVDSLHGLFLVAQENSTTDPGSSSIHVFDEQGNLVESLNGFHFSNFANVIPMHIAVHPVGRWGFVDGPDAGVREIQSFTY